MANIYTCTGGEYAGNPLYNGENIQAIHEIEYNIDVHYFVPDAQLQLTVSNAV